MSSQSLQDQPPKEHRETGATKASDYADPENWKYPIHRAENVRAAISYFSQPDNYRLYSQEQQRKMWRRMVAAAKKFEIEVSPDSGPPSVKGIVEASERKFKPGSDADKKHQGQRAKPEERIKGSSKNKPGTAKDDGGKIVLSASVMKGIDNKVSEHNEKHGDKKGKKVTSAMLAAVYRRGAGAFSVSHRPGMTRGQWAMARVNHFLKLVRTGKPDDPKYITDNDLLPKGHSRSTRDVQASEGHTPNKATAEVARRILEVRGKLPPSRRGMTPVGLARARDLANRRPMSEETIKRMVSFFARHSKSKSADEPSASSPLTDSPSKWRQAWDGWGGEPGRKWAARISSGIDRREAQASEQAVVLGHMDDLPPKPVDDGGRHVAWLWVTGEPGFHARDAKTGEPIIQVVDDEFIDRQIDAFEVLTKRGYSPPLAAMHPESIRDASLIGDLVEVAEGERGGDILKLSPWTDEHGRSNLVAAVAFNDQEAESKLGREIKFFSPAFGSILMDTGEELPFVLKELSKVVAPHQKGRSTHVLASEIPVEGQMSTNEGSVALDERVGALEQGLAELKNGQVGTQTALSEISAKIAELANYNDPALEEEEEEKKEEVQMTEPAPVKEADGRMEELQAQLSEQKATISSLTDALTRQAFMGSFPAGATIELTEQNAEVFYQLSRRDPEGFKTLKATTKQPERAAAPVIPLFGNDGGVTAFEVELGQEGEEPEVNETDASTVYSSALKEAGSDANAALEIFKKKMGYV